MTKVVLSCAAVLLIGVAFYGITWWTGFGFDGSSPELARLRQALSLDAGMVVADVGAGRGQLTQALARAVGPAGRVFATDIDPKRLQALRTMLDEARVDNVTVVTAQAGESGLPDDCCDAIVLRRVYHHLTDPAAATDSLRRALRPGGRLAVIDFPPPPLLGRGSLGVPVESVVTEMTASGFEKLQHYDDWPGRGALGSYCVVFRRPIQPR